MFRAFGKELIFVSEKMIIYINVDKELEISTIYQNS